MNSKCPHSPLFLRPPAPAKLPRAPEGVPVIHPPPVTKSPPPQTVWLQVMSAWADETTTSARTLDGLSGSVTNTCRALTVIEPVFPLDAAVCSLMITVTFNKVTVWLGEPETTIGTPCTFKFTSSELPLSDGEVAQSAWARDMMKSALTATPAAVRRKSATEASELASVPWPMDVA